MEEKHMNDDDDHSAGGEEARRLHIKALIRQLRATYPEDASADLPDAFSEPVTTTLLLSTTPQLFIQWLKAHTRHAGRLKFPAPAGGGHFSLEPAHQIASARNASMQITTVSMHGLFKEDSGGVFMEYALISFVVIALGDGIAVQAKCRQPALAGYYRALLNDISSRWQGT
jgi:hypothetical protein